MTRKSLWTIKSIPKQMSSLSLAVPYVSIYLVNQARASKAVNAWFLHCFCLGRLYVFVCVRVYVCVCVRERAYRTINY